MKMKQVSKDLFIGRPFLLILFFVLVIFIVLFFFNDYRRHDDRYRTQMRHSLATGFLGATTSYDHTTQMIFEDEVNKPEVLKLIASALDDEKNRDAYRNELHRLMLPSYEKQKTIGILQFHFHLKDGTSFLRMHAPKKYGDNLFRRPAVKLVNTEQKRVTGYEVGYFADGYRYMYPLFFNGRHIGSIEFAITSNGIIDYMSHIYAGKYHFMIDRRTVNEMTYEDWKKMNYKECDLSEYFMMRNSDTDDAVTTAINQRLKKKVSGRLARMEQFEEKVQVNGKDHLIVFIPVKDVTGKPAAYFVQYMDDDYSGHHARLAMIDIVLFTLLLGGIFYSIDNIQSKRRSLTEKNIEFEQVMNALQQYKLLSHHARDIILFIASDGRIIEANEAAEKAYGYSQKELTSLSITNLRNGQTIYSVEEQMKQAMDHGILFETVHRRRDGSKFPVEVSSVSVEIKGEQVLLSIIRDITERKKAEEAVAKSEQFLQAIIDNEPECVKLLAEDGSLLMMNPAGLNMIQADSFEQVKGQSAYPMVLPVYREAFKNIIEDVFRGKPGRLEFEAIGLKGRHIWLDTHAVPLHNERGDIFALLGITSDITERRLSEQKLRKSERRLRQSQTVAKIGSWSWDLVNNTLDWSDEAFRRFDKDPETFTPTVEYFVGLIHPEDREAVQKAIQDSLENGTSYHIQPRIKNETGREWVLEGFGMVERDDTGKPVRFAGTVQDITERKKVEEALKKSGKNYRILIESLQEGIWAIDKDDNTNFVNKRMSEMLGYTPDEMIGKSVFAFMDEQGIQICKENIERRKKGINEQHDFELIKKDGGRINVTMEASSIFDDIGEYAGGVAGVIDITGRKKTEAKLLESEQKYRRLFTTVSVGWAYHKIIVDENENPVDYIFLEVNDAFETITGLKKENIIGRRVTEILPGIKTDTEDWIAKYGKVAMTGKSISLRSYSEQIKKWYSVAASSPEKYYFITVIEDISQQMILENEAIKLNTVLTAKNRELEQILFATSHDLKTPLVNIHGFAREMEYSLNELFAVLKNERLSEDVNKKISGIINEDIPEAMKFIQASVGKMNGLLESLLKLSRLGRSELKLDDLNMNSLIAGVLQSSEFQIKRKNIKIIVSQLPPCKGDALQIPQVFANLIGNALKHLDPSRKGIITISGRRDNGNAVYCVEDNGIGISPEHQEKIFEMFYQLRPGEGEGIGLNIVQRIIERHNGRVWLESEPGKGSRFYVSLPA